MEVRPFKALRYNADVVGDVGNCIAPPYDVINDEQQDELYRKSQYNIARITRGKVLPSDNGQENQYTRAAASLAQWMQSGALKQDTQDTIYGYVQDFEIDGNAFQRLTFIALGKMEDFGETVKPHEQIFPKPMLERLSLKKATDARFGLIFMLYEDPQEIADRIIKKTSSEHALVDFVDEQAVRHRLYAIKSDDEIKAIIAMMADKSCVIADGHHRYTTGLTYYRESGDPAKQYQMLAFTNTRQKGLVVLATHRAVGGLDNFDPHALLSSLTKGFDISKFVYEDDASKESAKQQMLTAMKNAHDQDQVPLGIYMGDGHFYTAILKDTSLMATATPERSPAWRSLDVSVLQKLILEKFLGLDDEQLGNPDCVAYVKDRPNAIDELIADVDADRRQVAFFTNPVKMQQLMAVTDAGERMPQKSTYFYPKMYTGLTIQKF